MEPGGYARPPCAPPFASIIRQACAYAMTLQALQPVTLPASTSNSPRQGNSLRACFASLLGCAIDELPVFEQMHATWWQDMWFWFRDRGLDLRLSRYSPAQGVCVAYGPSPRGAWLHAVVWSCDGLVHDPHPDGAGLAGPPLGYWYVTPLQAFHKQDAFC